MKILYITTMYPIPEFPQQGIFCHEQVKALMKLGIEVTVAVPVPFYDRTLQVKLWDYEGVDIRYIRFFKLPGATDFHKTGKSFYQSLKRRVDLHEYDIYHADATLPSGYAAMLASKKYKKPFIVHGHGLDVYLEESYAKYKNCSKIVQASIEVYEEADAIVGVSKKVLDKINNKIDARYKSYVVYNGVDTEKFYPVNKKSNGCINIVSIGNLIPLKGHEYTIRAIKRLVDEGYDNVRMKLLGRGEQKDHLKQLIDKLQLDKYIDMIGYVPYDMVVEYLQKADIFVLPSDYEALGCVYLEAMACGLPALGCNGNGIDEIIIHKNNGYLVDGKNVKQIVQCIKEFLNRDNQFQIKKNARDTVVNQYQWMHSAKSLVDIYIKLSKEEAL